MRIGTSIADVRDVYLGTDAWPRSAHGCSPVCEEPED